MKGLIVSVLRNAEIGDCTNGGLSSKYTSILLVGEGVPEIFDESENRPTMKLVRRRLFNRDTDYLHIEPIDDPSPGHVGWMSGGNFAWSSDSRFPNNYPISIHDRQETTELYETLSR